MQTEKPKGPCNGCGGGIATERNRYFTGKYMTARDFESEQRYFLNRHELHNRLLHGWGIVCGLRVLPHPNPECAPRWVVVRAGIALDCCGHEIILNKDTPVEVPLPEPLSGPPPDPNTYKAPPAPETSAPKAEYKAGESSAAEPSAGEEAQASQGRFEGKLLLCVRYAEEPIENVPVLYNEGVCDPQRREANRVREVPKLEFLRMDEVEPSCWKTFRGAGHQPCRDDCDEELPGPAGICLEPECPCGHRVPLALLEFDPYHPDAGLRIDVDGRRELPLPHEFHTHIVGLNWPHGGDVTLSHLRHQMRGRLEVRFDRKLLPADGHKTGVNAMTFVVQYGGVQRDIKNLPFARDRPPQLENDCLAVFHINNEFTDPEEENNVADNWVYVTLKCDFILDCHGNAVDGTHLQGRVPTGDGRGGGNFESWFRVLDDKHPDYERRKREEQDRRPGGRGRTTP